MSAKSQETIKNKLPILIQKKDFFIASVSGPQSTIVRYATLHYINFNVSKRP